VTGPARGALQKNVVTEEPLVAFAFTTGAEPSQAGHADFSRPSACATLEVEHAKED